MTVRELIELLKTYPQDLDVAYRLYSENCLLEVESIRIETLCEPREDGWVPNRRPDKPTRDYLLFPGN
jgi:hypothetical protein